MAGSVVAHSLIPLLRKKWSDHGHTSLPAPALSSSAACTSTLNTGPAGPLAPDVSPWSQSGSRRAAVNAYSLFASKLGISPSSDHAALPRSRRLCLRPYNLQHDS